MNHKVITIIKKYFAGRSPVHISLFILVPFIFTGFAILTFIIARYTSSASMEQLLLLGGGVIVFTAFTAVAVTYAILNPIRKFIKEAESSPAFLKSLPESKPEPGKRDDISHFDYVFREVTNMISKLDARERFPDIVGQSRAIRGGLSQVIKVAPTDTTVLILGESGVGKERIAEAIYRESNRRDKTFVKLNCVAIPAGLLESELFGYEKGAFTGAVARKIGKFELAHDGTLFLDEIGDMPPETQAKLLRVLQEQEFQRVGGNQTIKVNVRFIAASNKNLHRMVKEGTFREDLFYRLNVFSIIIPPLRERVEDIPLLAEYILNRGHGSPVLSPEAMRGLMTYTWPGNVRELENVLARAAVMAENGRIQKIWLPNAAESVNAIAEKEANELPSMPDLEGRNLDELIIDYEKKLIVEALEKSGGIQARAALLLGINQRSLWHRAKKYKIDVRTIKKQQNM